MGVVHGLTDPVVCVVDDPAFLVGLDGLARHDPIDGGFAVDHIAIGIRGDLLYGDAVVVEEDGGAVVDGLAVFFLSGVVHLFHAVVLELHGGALEGGGVGFDGFVVKMQMGELPSGPGEGPESFEALDGGDAGELFA